MKIYNVNNILMENYDESKGFVREEKRFVAHHPPVKPVKEKGHYETIREYPNGGKDVRWVVDVEGVAAQEAWDEYEDILRFVEYTEEELAQKQKEFFIDETAPLDAFGKLLLFAELIEEEPYPEHLPKKGYKYQRVYSKENNKIVWVLVPDVDNFAK